MIKFKTRYITIEVDEYLKCLVQHWGNYLTSEDFRTGILESLEIFKFNSLSAIISDTTRLQAIKKEDSEFAASTMPEFKKFGLKVFAFVVPHNLFTQIAVDTFTKSSKDYLPIRYFEEFEEAKNWVRNE